MARATRPERRLLHQIGDERKAGRQLVLVLDLPPACLNDLRHGSHVERRQPKLVAAVADKLDDFGFILRSPIHLRRKVGADLEELLELFVQAVERIVRLEVADQHDFQIKRDRLRTERRGRQDTRLLNRVFDPDPAVPQRLLEPFPGERLAQQHAGVQQQISAVSPVQCARLDIAVVGDERAQLRAHLHPPDQVAVGRVRLDNYGRAG